MIDLGPGAGVSGGEILYKGKPLSQKLPESKYPKIMKNNSWILLKKPQVRNIKIKELKIPTEKLTWVYGPSGVGKTSIVQKVLVNEVLTHLKLKKRI